MTDKKPTSSDKIKEIFRKHSLGEERDWKRMSKTKDANGQPLRVFKNIKTGAEITVIEKADGSFEFQHQPKTETTAPLPVAEDIVMPANLPPARSFIATLMREIGGEENDWKLVKAVKNDQGQDIVVFQNEALNHAVALIALGEGRYGTRHFQIHAAGFELVEERPAPRPAKTPAEIEAEKIEHEKWKKDYEARLKKEAEEKALLDTELLAAPAIDKRVETNALADKIIDKILICEDIDEDELKAAGKALANRFGFGIGFDDGTYGAYGLYVCIAPLADVHYDQHMSGYIGHLLPDGLDEACEAAFSFEAHRKPAILAEELLRRGFIFSPELQAYADENMKWPMTDRLQKLQEKIHNEGKQKPGPKPPQV